MTEPSMGDSSVTIFCLMRPQPGKASELRDSLLGLVPPTRAEAGCVAYHVYGEDDGSLVLYETWSSRQTLAAHQQQPAIKAFFGDQLKALLAEDMDVHFGTLLPTRKDAEQALNT